MPAASKKDFDFLSIKKIGEKMFVLFFLTVILLIVGCNEPRFPGTPDGVTSGDFDLLESETNFAQFAGCLPGFGMTCRGVWEWSAEDNYLFWINGECAGHQFGTSEKWLYYIVDEGTVYSDGETYGWIETGGQEWLVGGQFTQKVGTDSPGWLLEGRGVYTGLNGNFDGPSGYASAFSFFRINQEYDGEITVECP